MNLVRLYRYLRAFFSRELEPRIPMTDSRQDEGPEPEPETRPKRIATANVTAAQFEVFRKLWLQANLK